MTTLLREPKVQKPVKGERGEPVAQPTELTKFLNNCITRIQILPAGEVPLGEAVGCAAGASGLVPAGEVVTVATAMELATRGFSSLRVHPRPRTLVLAVGAQPSAGERAELLGALLEVSGVRVSSFSGLADDTDEALEILETQLDSTDLVVLTSDENTELFTALCEILDLSVVSLRSEPGGTCAFTEIRSPGGRNVPMVILPTDLKSMSILAEVLVGPMARRRAGDHQIYRPIVRAKLTAPVTPKMRGSARDRGFIPGRLHAKGGVWHVEPLATLNAPAIKGLAENTFATSNCLIVVPSGTKELEVGDVVGAMRIDGRRVA